MTRGICPSCGREFAVNKDGTLRAHKECLVQESAKQEEAWTGTDRSSKPGGPGSAKSADTGSKKVTSSVPTGKADTSTLGVPMTDAFESAKEPEQKFDGYGRYLLPHPETGKRQAWTRATTFAGSIVDEFGLGLWKQRMVAKGMALRPDLVAMVSSLDVKADSKKINALTEKAKESAGASASANLGTAIHSFTENVDAGGSLDDVPAPQRPDVAAYADALSSAGIRVVPGMIERTTVVPRFGVAGKFDRVILMPDGTYVIGDVKTGKDLSYDWLKICVQLCMYSIGVNDVGVMDSGAWTKEGVPRVSTEYAIVMHIPAGTAVCTLYRVDLLKGATYAQLCSDVRAARKDRMLSQVWTPADCFAWEERFTSVTSRADASELYKKAKSDPSVDGHRLSTLVSLAQEALGLNS